jgi:hypothetical protein
LRYTRLSDRNGRSMMSWMRRYAVRCCRMPSLLSPSSSGHQHHPSLKRRRRQITASAGLGSHVETDLAREFVRRFHPHAREGTVQNVRNRRGRFPWKLESLPQKSTSRDCRARARSRCGKDTTKTRDHKPPESSSRPSAMSMTRKFVHFHRKLNETRWYPLSEPGSLRSNAQEAERAYAE